LGVLSFLDKPGQELLANIRQPWGELDLGHANLRSTCSVAP
jgi:hypothetical protein